MQNDKPNFNSAQFLSVLFQPSGSHGREGELPLNLPPPFPVPQLSASERNIQRPCEARTSSHSQGRSDISNDAGRLSVGGGGASGSSSIPFTHNNSLNATRTANLHPRPLPFATPNAGVTNPVTIPREGGSPALITPMQGLAHPMAGMNFSITHPSTHANPKNSAQFCSCNRRIGESCSFCWSWDSRSETSAPSLWSAASTRISFRSKASGQYVVGQDLDACIDGQRLLYVKPQQLTTSGGKVYIELIRTIPQPLYSEIEVLLVAGKQGMINLKPQAIRKGKKLCVQIPHGLDEGQDYDVRVKFAGKMLHGSFPLEIRDMERDRDGASD